MENDACCPSTAIPLKIAHSGGQPLRHSGPDPEPTPHRRTGGGRYPGARGHATTGVAPPTARARGAIDNRPATPHFHDRWRRWQPAWMIGTKIGRSRSLVAPVFIRLPRRSHSQPRSTKMSFRAQPRNLRRSSPNHSFPRQSHLDTRGRRARECQSRVRSGAVLGSAPFS